MVSIVNRTGIKRIIGWLIVILIVGLLSREQFERMTLDRSKAREHAMNVMETICGRDAPALGIRCENFLKLVEKETRSRHFEFIWHFANGLRLEVGVWDNGLFIDDLYSWWEESRNTDGSVTLNPILVNSLRDGSVRVVKVTESDSKIPNIEVVKRVQ